MESKSKSISCIAGDLQGRLDILVLRKRSVANDTNYGDDLHAGSLITPTCFQFLGISAEETLRVLP